MNRKPYTGRYFRRINARRHQLIDVLFSRGLTRCEWFEYAAIEAQMERDDAVHFGPIIENLKARLASQDEAA